MNPRGDPDGRGRHATTSSPRSRIWRDQAKSDEQVYIQYSGMGLRNDATLLPGLEPDGRAEAIAPADSRCHADPASFYILDKELGSLTPRITDTGAFVTLVLDCCHSASMTRNVRRSRSARASAARPKTWRAARLGRGDPRPRPDSTLVAPLAELKALVAAPDGRPAASFPHPGITSS